MKKFLTLFVSLIFGSIMFAQTYGNEWIDYTKSYYKIKVAKDALYRIDYNTLFANGVSLNGDNYKMFHKGEEIPIYVSTSGNLSNADYIEFYGERNTGYYDTELYEQPDFQPNPYLSNFTDTSAYYLGVFPGTTNLRIENETNTVSGNPTPHEYFNYKKVSIANSGFFNGVPLRYAGVNIYDHHFQEGEGFTGSTFNWVDGANNPIVESSVFLNLYGIYQNGTQTVDVEIVTAGESDDFLSQPDHKLKITMNGNNLNILDDTWEGYDLRRNNWTGLPLGWTNNPTEFIFFAQQTTSKVDRQAVYYITVDYPKSYDFANDNNLLFTINANVNQSDFLVFQNFNDVFEGSVLYDFETNSRFVTANNNNAAYLLPNVNVNERTLFVSKESAVIPITSLQKRNFKDFSQTNNQGNYILISHPYLMNDTITGDNYVQDYANYRASNNGGAYNTTVADVTQLYDQFAYGIEHHPRSIKNFVAYALDNFSIAPEHLFLLGKAYKYGIARTEPLYSKNLVPTYGEVSSDTYFGYYQKEEGMLLSVGRLAAREPQHVADYLTKVQNYEFTSALPCTEEARQWMKHVFHIAGGTSLSQQNEFNAYLDNYETIIADSLYGGNVYAFYKNNAVPITSTPDELMDSLINDAGVSLLTFFGHAAGETWEVDIRNPAEYNNSPKFPFILANSCFVGDIFQNPSGAGLYSMSEEWVLEANKGSIAYLAAIQNGFPSPLNIYSTKFYEQVTSKNYNKPSGTSVMNVVNEMLAIPNLSIGERHTLEEMILHGDPAIIIAKKEHPEFLIKSSDIYFEPEFVTAQMDSFAVNVVLNNLGAYVEDSINIKIVRTFPDGNVETVVDEYVTNSNYIDTFSINVYTEPTTGFGANQIEVIIDEANTITEICDEINNNTASANLFVTSDNFVPIDPCCYAIMNTTDITLKASTATPIIEESNFLFQMDTTELFNSYLLLQQPGTTTGGVIEWTPNFTFANFNNTVFYWRIGKVEADTTIWRNCSFLYDKNAPSMGWNQSHYYQYKRGCSSENMTLNPDTRLWEYQDNLRSFRAITHGKTNVNGVEVYLDVNTYINNNITAQWSCVGEGNCSFAGGVQVMVINDATLQPVQSLFADVNPYAPNTDCDNYNIVNGNFHCSGIDVNAFDFPISGISNNITKLNTFLNNVPDGYYVIIKSIKKHGIHWDGSLNSVLDPLYNTLSNVYGITEFIPQSTDLPAEIPFIAIAQKNGALNPLVEIGDSVSQFVELELTLEGKWVEGRYKVNKTIPTDIVGPASNWTSMKFEPYSLDAPSFDETVVRVYGIKSNLTEEFLFQTTNLDTSLANLNANFHPYLRLENVNRDETNNTAPQLNYWKVYFDGILELAIDAEQNYNLLGDSLSGGSNFQLSFDYENTSAINSDSILISYVVIDGSLESHTVATVIDAPLNAGESTTTSVSFPSNPFIGNNVLYVTVNPTSNRFYYQNEKYNFNNTLIIPFNVAPDNVNPLLDVTFDGVHILDGDIVSAKPEIGIKIKDESVFVALSDTAIAEITITHPDGMVENIEFADNTVEFIPADENNLTEENLAQIFIRKAFEIDGSYELNVKARDMAGNLSGDLNHKINFKVFNKALISDMVNYPNPFSTSTQFVFTLTGSQIPDVFKIQIMTLSGKVVKEIDKNEIGNLHIGRNVTDYTWDGKDQYGGTLANGVYLYRVITRLEDAAIDKLTSNALRDFDDNVNIIEGVTHKSGFGKMYILR